MNLSPEIPATALPWLLLTGALFTVLLFAMYIARRRAIRQRRPNRTVEDAGQMPSPLLTPETLFLESDIPEGALRPRAAAVRDVPSEEKSPCRTCRCRPDFRTTFLHNNYPRPRAAIYVSVQTKQTIGRIVQRLDAGKISQTAYVDNILRQHLECYQDEINRLHREQNPQNIV